MKHSYNHAHPNLPVILAFLALSAAASHAQLKTGSNPSTLSTNINFEVEAANGAKAAIRKDNGYTGIGTATPDQKLTIVNNGGTSSLDDNIAFYSYGGTGATHPGIVSCAARGTEAVPANLLPGDPIYTPGQAKGYVDNKWQSLAYIDSYYRGDGKTLTSQTIFTQGNGAGLATPLTLFGDKVGINNANPTEALHISGGNLRYDHPSKAAGKVLTSDANGIATWQSPTVDSVVGVISSGVTIPYNADGVSTPRWVYTGSYITLPPGRWLVSVHAALIAGDASITPANSSFWVRAMFSDSSTTLNNSPDTSNWVYGSVSGSATYGLLSGSLVINNVTSGNKTYYFCGGYTSVINSTLPLTSFGGSGQGAGTTINAIRL